MSNPIVKPKIGDSISVGVNNTNQSKSQIIVTVTPTVSNNKTNYNIVGAKNTINTDEDYLILSHVLANGQQFFVMGK